MVVFLRGGFRLIGKRRCAKGVFVRGANEFSISIGGFVKKGKNPPTFPQGLGISRKSTIESSQQGLISTAKLEAFKHEGTQVAFPLLLHYWHCVVLYDCGWVRVGVGVWVRVEGSEPVVEACRPQLPPRPAVISRGSFSELWRNKLAIASLNTFKAPRLIILHSSVTPSHARGLVVPP